MIYKIRATYPGKTITRIMRGDAEDVAAEFSNRYGVAEITTIERVTI